MSWSVSTNTSPSDAWKAIDELEPPYALDDGPQGQLDAAKIAAKELLSEIAQGEHRLSIHLSGHAAVPGTSPYQMISVSISETANDPTSTA